MIAVLFACVHNAGRSQMAAAWFNRLVDPAAGQARSAGTAPAGAVHPEVVTVMREVGIELADARPARLTEALAAEVQVLVTMGCGETCPLVPGLRRLDWQIPDPKGQPLSVVRAIRDDLRARVGALIDTLGLARAPG